MRTQQQQLNYQQLELIETPPVKPSRTQVFLTIFRNFCNTLLLMFTSSDEPQISRAIDAAGKPHWEVYDPRTGRSVLCDSEQDIRVWMEQRFSSQLGCSADSFAPRQFLNRFY